jgi:tRNA(Ile)-lysidine synthetase-like protein
MNYLFGNTYIDYIKYKNILQYIPKINNKIIKKQYYNDENDIVQKVKEFCQNDMDKKFIVSLSGGVDSMVLISVISYLGYEVIGVHLNYNNRVETKDEERFLKEWCNFNNIKLYVENINTIKRADSGNRRQYELETKNIRFNFYKKILEKESCEYIILGHHKDDIVENIFANVCRGRYILDLAVIKYKSIVNGVTIGRPLIEIYKKEIFDFASDNNIPYFIDTTPGWSIRGKYRNEIYPRLEDAFSKSVKNNLLGLSRQSYEWNELIMKQIVDPFMEKVKFCDKLVEFNVEKYIDFPLCFWSIVFMKIFYYYGINCPSRKAIKTFMSSIPTIGNASISNKCCCYIKNTDVRIVFL